MDIPANAFKRAILNQQRQIGLWSSTGSAAAVEMLGHAGYDWILLDTEHTPIELPDIVSQMRAMIGTKTEAVVRPAWNDPVLIKRFLDAGAQTLLVPFVQNEDEALQAVRSMRYPPHGIRGVSMSSRANRYGRVTDYFRRVNDELCLLVQLETGAALKRLEAIAAVDGVDGIFIGPSDLSADLGRLGNAAHPEVQAAIRSAVEKCRKLGKAAGILAPIEEDARRYLEWGFSFVAVGVDMGLLRNASDDLLKRFRD
ncbi:HpcH/HpaI aldolase family protein [Microvirga makkahensis]|uniref:4-hydroxy-2-oxo-heptane-1,7-dioate aldolase n=1 Tax=Microvirga makkahensis TaxID=1128670 RepID=A0A7X3MVL3_9HYPH|nr:HpcH/HpaI aldolase/citrate lyase family protein [Microvirga makkahensis]MXQ14037.1 4-hydroxy-2-oxo-heptane-1,7-dioate aldolase [Microvirga makkahensis]